MRKIVILLMVLALIYGIYSVITNVIAAGDLGDNCLVNPGMLTFLCPVKFYVSTLNKLGNATFYKIQIWLGVLFCFVWIVSIRIIRSMGRILNKKIDSFLDSSSDYVIQISNLPFGGYTEVELLKYVKDEFKKIDGMKGRVPGIKGVQIVYQMDEARKMIGSIISNARKLASNLTKKQRDDKTIFAIKEGHLETYLSCKMEMIKSMIKIE